MIYPASSLKLRVNSHDFNSLGPCGCFRQREPNDRGTKMQKQSVCLENDQETNIESPAPGFTITAFHLPSRTAVQFCAGLCWFRLLSWTSATGRLTGMLAKGSILPAQFFPAAPAHLRQQCWDPLAGTSFSPAPWRWMGLGPIAKCKGSISEFSLDKGRTMGEVARS